MYISRGKKEEEEKKKISPTYMHTAEKRHSGSLITNRGPTGSRGLYESWQDYQERSVLLLFGSAFPSSTQHRLTQTGKSDQLREGGGSDPFREKPALLRAGRWLEDHE